MTPLVVFHLFSFIWVNFACELGLDSTCLFHVITSKTHHALFCLPLSLNHVKFCCAGRYVSLVSWLLSEFWSVFILLYSCVRSLAAMDTTTSLKMTSLAVQSLFSYVEEENLAAIKAHLDKFKDVDSRSDVSQTGVWQYLNCLSVEQHKTTT